ncbi:TIGR00725 family protein [Pigmentiphaga aceris]|nr:TIGR00725 family protein [Pigmentiphaga aceris]
MAVTDMQLALARRQRGGGRLRQPVAMIGPGDGSPAVCADAREIAGYLARAGMTIVCGGRGGVMEAASRGATENGGIAIGFLPEEDLSAANRYLSIALPTGMGEMRNALIARSAVCLVAVGGGMGTISEMALGLKWGKRVFTLHADLVLPGATACADVPSLLTAVMGYLVDVE